MKYIDETFASPAENLAWDEALLNLCEAGEGGETLRFWEAREPFVVVGYANHAACEVNLAACWTHGISVFRRCSGGGTVLQGPGCLSYSLILRIRENGPYEGIGSTNTFIMQRHQTMITRLLNTHVHIQGHTDLAINNLKFSGNAQRRRRQFLIFHGTFVLNFDLALIEKFLQMPSNQPEYRRERPHSEFVTNLNLPSATLKNALRQIWNADDTAPELPAARLREAAEKYSTDAWNLKF
jgi:lipoate-protein ligase A